MAFVQLIEFKTDRLAEIDAAFDEWIRESRRWRTVTRFTRAQDRDVPGTYVKIVEFPSYEAAMENSRRVETTRLSDRLAALCSEPPIFRNLDVGRTDHF